MITPINRNIASKPFKWFQKTSVTVCPWGRDAISLFYLRSPCQALVKQALSISQQQQILPESTGQWWEHSLSHSHREEVPIPKPCTQIGATPRLQAKGDPHSPRKAQ